MSIIPLLLSTHLSRRNFGHTCFLLASVDSMPQQRQRIVFCDCLDCVQQPPTTDIASSSSPANEAAARQEPPPKCLMWILSGVLLPGRSQTPSATDTLLGTCNLPHIDRAAAQGNLCLLTSRLHSSADCRSELAQLFGVYEELEQHKQPTSVADRFKGMQVSFSSNSSAARDVAAACGMSISSILHNSTGTNVDAAAASDGGSPAAAEVLLPGLSGTATKHRHGAATTAAAAEAAAAALESQLPDPAEAARRIMQELGLQQPEAGLDMVVVHVDNHNLVQAQQQQQQVPEQQQQQQQVVAATAAAVLSWLDRTLRYLNNSSAFKDTVLLAVAATPGAAGKLPVAVPMLADQAGGTVIQFRQQQPASVNNSSKQESIVDPKAIQSPGCRGPDDWAIAADRQQVLRPLQSWQQLGGVPLDIDPQRPILCMRRLPGVIRRDGCTQFSLAECCSSSGVLGLLVDRLIPEIAYKLGRAPKYGA